MTKMRVYEYAKKMNMSRNGYIREALNDYIKLVKKKQVESELARESMLVRQESMRINKEFDSTLGDGISDEY